MAVKYVGKLITDTQVFAMSEGITTTTYNIQKQSSLATQMNDGERTRYIVKAGTPVPSNDANCVGLVFENWDVTDNGGPIPIAISGCINEVNAAALGITYTDNCKSALRNFNFLGSNMDTAAVLTLSAEPATEEEDYDEDVGLSFTVTLSGDTFIDDVAANPINWVIGLPSGFSVAGIAKTSTTVYTVTIKAVDGSDSIPSGARITFGVLSQAMTNGGTPAEAICDFDFAESEDDGGGENGGGENGGDEDGGDEDGGDEDGGDEDGGDEDGGT